MKHKAKASMGDEDKAKPKVRLSQRPSKIIIRKYKKSSPSSAVSKTTEDSKKVNGELSTENKDKDSDNIGKSGDEYSKELDSMTTPRSAKRKASETLDEDIIIIENDIITSEERNDNESDGKDDFTSVEFKGFKKRILAQTEKLKDGNTDDTEQGKNDSASGLPPEGQPPAKLNLRPRISKINKIKKKSATNGKKANKADSDENQADSQAEYAQYLGLQPTMQFKCYRCGEKGFPSLHALNGHQRGCGIAQKSSFITNIQQDTTMPPSDPNMLTNFRITRKVYLCSACGTYYENWNLFLHMRDVHKKHICLFCLTMFGTADKLADHLKTAHKIQESTFKSSEEFQNSYKGSCYLICCTCENMFSEREDYFYHNCMKTVDPTAKCRLCGVKCGHYYTCPNSNTPKTLTSSSSVSNQPTTVSKAQSATLSKYNLTVPKSNQSEEPWMGKKAQGIPSSDNDEDYDISHAASFCHVDIADESGDRDKSGTEDTSILTKDDNPIVIQHDSFTSKTIIPIENDEETGPSMPLNENQEENALTETVAQTVENVSEKTDTIVEQEINQEKSDFIKENSTDCSNREDTNDKIIEEEQPIKNDSDAIDDSNDKAVDVNLSEDFTQERVSNDEEREQSSEGEPSRKQNHPEGTFQEDATIEKVDETSIADLEKTKLSSQKNNDDSVSSDSCDEPETNLSTNQDDSDSSSEDSCDEMKKKLDTKQAVEIEQENSASNSGDSDDSEKSGLVMDEKIRNSSNIVSEDSINNPDETVSNEPQCFQETKNADSNEASKDFYVDTNFSIDKHSENAIDENGKAIEEPNEPIIEEINDGIPLAGDDVPAMALTLEDKLENTSSQFVIKECVRTSCLNCVYCSHAVKIAVNGKQLALHLLAEHRYKPVKNNETSLDVIKKLKNSLNELESVFFNTDSYDSSDKSLNTSYDYTYHCFQCRFVTKVHKELYVHKRKMHQKTVMLCVMCKGSFYSYSELLCHMCPGIYAFDDTNFRCCFCSLDLIPSGFRLMVHLRKSHHTCDICLEVAGDQQKLSTHMWKHKLNHICYRCEIAYRNKPDITKHLFWKHGTESVLCKKCLQKKWPHVYHFCIPPTVFICEECNTSFTKAVALKVHKRFHGGEYPYNCKNCDKKFVSKKLLAKHEELHSQTQSGENSSGNNNETDKHNESIDEPINVDSIDEPGGNTTKDSDAMEVSKESDSKLDIAPETKTKKRKKKDRDRKEKTLLDVYDLPPLNLSSESDSSDEEIKATDSEQAEEKTSEPTVNEDQGTIVDAKTTEPCTSDNVEPSEENLLPAPVVDGVWDNFQSYKAELEKRESKDNSIPNILPSTSTAEPEIIPEPEKQVDQPNLPSTLTAEPEIIPEPEKQVDEPNLPSTSTAEPEIIPEPEKQVDEPNLVLMDHSYCLIFDKPLTTDSEKEEPTIVETVPVSDVPTADSEETPAPRGHSSSIDHAYATLNNSSAESATVATESTEQPPVLEPPVTSPATPPPTVEPPTESHSNSKKKQKTPKKKKHNTNSSSSSDSSSDSDSSNCSCSDCSLSSSSSSSSSDSDTSTSEGRRRVAVRREKKKERLKHKHHKEESTPAQEEHLPPPIEDEPVVDVPEEPVELPIRESDLDTEESSTDEDFYDRYPKSQAKQQMEKRNLMLLASVAPVNNGTVSPPLPTPQSPPPPAPPIEQTSPPSSAIRKKIKTKRRRKSQQSKKSSSKTVSQHQQIKPSTSVNLPSATSTPVLMSTNHHNLVTKIASPLRTSVTNLQSDATAGSGSENESARLSKRKRVRNKFYGYSSEEEEQGKPKLKWRRVESAPSPQLSTSGVSFQPSLSLQRPQVAPLQIKRPKQSESSESEEEEEENERRVAVKKAESSNSSSSSSSESENEVDSKENVQKEQTEKSDNLYCYCQCPYDEVSEMIACDGQDCTIEWFHFECVGIMVPPKGKWYCPECRKKRDFM